MTEREQKARTPQPTLAQVLAAVESLGQAYHAFASAFSAWQDDDRKQRELDKEERRYLRQRVDQLFGQLDLFQRKVDRQFDEVWREIDALKGQQDAGNTAGQ